MKFGFSSVLWGIVLAGIAPISQGQMAVGCSPDYLFSGFRPGFEIISEAGPQPRQIATGDFNADGLVDIAVLAEQGSNTTFSILLGQGDGSFGAPQTYDPPGTNILDLQVGDFNGDGRSDVVVSIPPGASGNVLLYLANADGSLQAPSPTPAVFLWKLSAIDLDQDGHLDLVGGLRMTTSGVKVLYGNGDGTFQSEQTLIPGVGVFDIAFGDFDDDGLVDVALTDNLGPTSIEIYLRNLDGSFVLANTLLPPETDDPFIAVADLNGDGIDDVVSRRPAGGPLRVWLATGGGNFAAQVELPDSSSPSSLARSFVLADLDGDGDIDIAGGSSMPVSVQYHANNGDGTFAPPVRAAVEGNIRDVLVADLYNLGQPDLIAAIDLPNTSNDRIQVYRNSCFFFPVVTQQPESTLAPAGGQAVLSVAAGGAGPLFYQWRRNESPISDTATIFGAQTPMLTLDQITPEQAGAYDVVVTNAVGEARSFPAVVAVTPTMVPCPVDLNGDGDANTFDLLDLLRAVDAGCP